MKFLPENKSLKENIKSGRDEIVEVARRLRLNSLFSIVNTIVYQEY